jgi:hypothetical protein
MHILLLLVLIALLSLAAEAPAAFPGSNGRIAYALDAPIDAESVDIYTVNPDGSRKPRTPA